MKALLTRRRALLGSVAAVAVPCSAWAAPIPKRKVGQQLILAIDVSLSVRPHRYKMQTQGYLKALMDERVLDAIKNLKHGTLGLMAVEWSGTQKIRVPWTCITGKESMAAFCAAFEAPPRPNTGMYTRLGAAMTFCGTQFDTVFEGGRKVLDVSGDGAESFWLPSLLRARGKLLQSGVVVNGLPILVDPGDIYPAQPKEGLDVYYKNHVVGGEGHILVPSRGFEEFPEAILRKLVLEIA